MSDLIVIALIVFIPAAIGITGNVLALVMPSEKTLPILETTQKVLIVASAVILFLLSLVAIINFIIDLP